ncbi:MFS transporter [Pseudogracilibacillus sp. SO30301A]|uniref:MFS transporter n=1 Tax=Pseudogracilibacillus sp. SO30301A TaxID=3098291 RepID=UPI00300DE217
MLLIAQISLTYSRQISLKSHINFNLAVFCFWFSIYIYVPLFGVYLENIGFSYSAIGIILGAYGVTQIVFRLPLGILSDVLHKIRKHLLIGGFICAFLSCFILIYFEAFLLVLFARLLAGITASMWVMATVLYSYYFTPDKAAKAMGTMQFNTVTTQLICMAVSGFLIHLFGWNFPFWLGAITSLLGIYFAWNIKEVDVKNQDKTELNVKEYLKSTNSISGLKMVTFLSLIAHAVLFITIFGFSPLMAVSIGISEHNFVWLMCAFFIPHALISLGLMVFNLDPKYNRMVLVVSFIFTALFLICIPFANSLLSISLYHAGLGLALGFIFPLLLSEVVKISPNDLKMSAMGYYQSFYALGILIGPIVAGVVAEQAGLKDVFLYIALITFISALILLFWKRN